MVNLSLFFFSKKKLRKKKAEIFSTSPFSMSQELCIGPYFEKSVLYPIESANYVCYPCFVGFAKANGPWALSYLVTRRTSLAFSASFCLLSIIITILELVTMFVFLFLGFAKANEPWAGGSFDSFRNFLTPLYCYVSGNDVSYSCFVGFAKANGPWAWVIWWPEGQVWLLISWQGLHALPVKSARRSWRCRHRRTTKSKAYY